MSKSVRPTINDIEGNDGGGAIAGNQEEDGFARMMEPFDQDKEEEEDAATEDEGNAAIEDEGNQEQEEANKAIAPRIPNKPS